MQPTHQLPGFSADSSLEVSATKWRSMVIPGAQPTDSQIQPQGCCLYGPFGICVVSSPLCP